VIEDQKNIDRHRVVKHTIFWFIWICSFTILQSFGFGISDYGAWLVYYLVTLPLFMIHTYAIAYWLVPKYFFTHRYLLFSLGIFVLLNLASIGELLISNELVWKLVKPGNIQPGNYLNLQNILINGLGNEYIIIVFLSVKVVRFWNSKMGEKAELMNQKLSTEIELLQYQSYPRFVLNVMDHLEHLAVDQSPLTSEMIIRLSGMMNNISSRQKSEKILLHKETELIKSYIEIQKMSAPKSLNVSFQVKGNLNSLQIPPFLFFQVVEEGFAVTDHSEKTDLAVLIKTESNALLFSMTLWNDQLLKKPFSQIVMENCRKYLSYFYPENHKVISNFEINFVEVTIEIYL
jgi:sensor histidine kinase YesM